jgi:prepilin-type N-terminal cleavage/methylation domain-containing protein
LKKSKGFTLIELLIVMAVIAILIAIAIPSFRGMQNEARKTKAQGDVRVLKTAIESYYKNHQNLYPLATTSGNNDDWEELLTGATPRVLEAVLYDPFGSDATTEYTYKTDTGSTATSQYYVIYSVGPQRVGNADVGTAGTVSSSSDAIWESNGHI